MYLPTEEELREELNRDRVEAEQALRLHEATEGATSDENGQA
jgi:hypothetical protein